MTEADAAKGAATEPKPEDFNIEEALEAFLADVSSNELRLPPLDPEQRKQAKKLAEKYPEIKCESYGFGEERRLHLFKTPAALKAGLAKEGCREGQRTECASDQSTAVSGATSPESTEDASGGAFEEIAALPSNLYQVRNTFIHIEERGVADQRNIQSMPHGMFGQRLQEEAMQGAQDRVAGTDAPPAEPAVKATPPIPEEVANKEFAPGTEVVIEGLQKFPAFNGLRGTIQLLDKATGRYNVQLASTDGPLDQIAKIRGENLRMLVPPPPPFESSVTVAPSAMHARAPDFVPMQRMGLTSVPPAPLWQERHPVPPPMYAGQYDPYVHPAHSYPPVPPPVKYAAR